MHKQRIKTKRISGTVQCKIVKSRKIVAAQNVSFSIFLSLEHLQSHFAIVQKTMLRIRADGETGV